MFKNSFFFYKHSENFVKPVKTKRLFNKKKIQFNESIEN